MEKALTVVNFEEYAMTPEKVVRQINLIQEVMQKVMKSDEHYGTIPGCGPKPTLLKPGAEKISTTFRLAPEYKITKTDLKDGHREYEIVCSLLHIPTSQFVGQGVGACTTMEGKFRFRNAEKKCPECGKEAIIKGKAEYGGGWLCFKKKGGCGAKWSNGDPIIEDQADGKAEHDNPADYYNTVLKMAKKRAHVDAVLTATAASDIFTQDIEDMPEVINVTPEEPKAPKQKPKKEAKPETKEPEPPTAGQTKKIVEIGANNDPPLSPDEVKQVAVWYYANNDHGGRTYEAAQALIYGFTTIFDRFLDAREKEKQADY